MTLDRRNRYIFLLRDADGNEHIGIRQWTRTGWKSRRTPLNWMRDCGEWRVIRSDKPFWRGGPRMVLEVPA